MSQPEWETYVAATLKEIYPEPGASTLRLPAPNPGRGAPTRTGRPARAALAATAAAVLVAVVAVGVSMVRGHHATSPAFAPVTDPASTMFVTIAETNNSHGSGFVEQLQMRRVADGSLVRTVLTTNSALIAAEQTIDGNVLAALTTQCTTELKTVNLRAGTVSSLRTLADPVSATVLSPDGTKLAFTTPARQCIPDTCPLCFGLHQGAPQTLVIVDLATGKQMRTSVKDASSIGNSLEAVTWSPDGAQLAVQLEGRTGDRLLVLDANHPSLRAAQVIPAPDSCGLVQPAWTTSGIVAAERCDRHSSDLTKLIRISVAGSTSQTWDLPACVDGINATTDAAHRDAVVEIPVGYGNGTCGQTWTTEFVRTTADSLTTITREARFKLGEAEYHLSR